MADSEFPIIPTTHGYVKGRRCETIYGDVYYSFEKIPFAEPPFGDLRFKAPQPAKKWDRILECFQHGPKPLQRNRLTNELEGSEDCLYMNIYIKKFDTDELLPVLMYIYGGGFHTGGAVRDTLSPDYFMKENVILVTSTYRVGALGFMSFKDKNLGIPGNAGLKDQLAGLKWLKANCLNFNGDPNNITLFGNSAGGVSVHYLTITPKAKNLFHKAILQSGVAFTDNLFGNIDQHPYRLAKLNGYDGSSDDEKGIYNFLLKLKPEELSMTLPPSEETIIGQNAGFGPTYEPYESEDGLSYEHQKKFFSEAWGNKIPMIIGGNTDEGSVFIQRIKAKPRYMTIFKDNPELIVPEEVREICTKEEAVQKGKELIEKYLHKNLDHSNFREYVKFVGIQRFWYFTYRACMARLKYASSVPTYLYNFDFDSPTCNLFRIRFQGKDARGVAHGDELCYLFKFKNIFKLETSSREYQTIRRMVGMWCAFAKTSNPNCLPIAPAIWTPLKDERPLKCLNINDQVEVVDLPFTEDLEYFHEMYRNVRL